MFPLQVVLCTIAKETDIIATLCICLLLIDGCLSYLIVTQFLIAAQPSCLSFVTGTLETFLTFHTIDLRAVSRNCDRNEPGTIEVWSLGEAVVILYCTSEIDGLWVELYLLLLIAWVIDGYRTLLTTQLLDVLHQDVALALLFCDVSLQVKWILVEGDEVLVTHQLQRLRTNVGHIATNE